MATKFQYLNLDTINASYSNSQTYNSYFFNTSSSTKAPNSYNATWNLRKPIVNAKRIWLKSIELPIGFSNIRSTNFSNTLTINTASTGGTSYTITLPDKIYTSIQVLLNDINLFFVATYPSVNIVFSVVTGPTNNGFVQVTTSSTGIFPNGLFISNSMLANTILGFNQNTDIVTTTTRIAGSWYLLNADNYVNVFIPTISTTDCNVNGIPSSFKVPINSINGSVFYASSNLGYDS